MRTFVNIKYILVVAALLIRPLCGCAQNYAQDMEKIHSTYTGRQLSFKMSYLFYPYDSVATGVDSMHGSCSIEGNKYYYKLNADGSQFEYVKTHNYFFIIDHMQKVIALRSSADAGEQQWSVESIDSVIHTPSVQVTYKELGNNEGEYGSKVIRRV